MNLELFEEVEIKDFSVEKISTSLLTLFAKYISHGLKCMTMRTVV